MKQTLIVIVAFLFTAPTSVFALSEAQIRALDSNAGYVNTEITNIISCNTASSGGGIVSVDGENNREIAYNWLRANTVLDSNQAAGIVGNLMSESGVDPVRRQGGGYQTISDPSEIVAGVGFGIAQWTSGGRQQNWLSFAEEQGADPLTLELQLEFLVHEMSSNGSLGWEEILRAQDVRQATWVFLVFFERPASTSGWEENETQATAGSAAAALDSRTTNSQGVLDDFGTSEPNAVASCGAVRPESEPTYAAIDDIAINGAPTGAHSDDNCNEGLTEGAQALADYISGRWSPPVTRVVGYDCRAASTRENSPTDIHATGRAIDVMLDSNTATDTTSQDVAADTSGDTATGNEIRNFVINNAQTLGVQLVIWNGNMWSPDADGWLEYTGRGNFNDHVHIEINIEASENPNLI